LNQRFVDLFAHRNRRKPKSPTIERKEFDFDVHFDAPQEIHLDDVDAEMIDSLFNDLKVLSFFSWLM
jgi:hypothetical protein